MTMRCRSTFDVTPGGVGVGKSFANSLTSGLGARCFHRRHRRMIVFCHPRALNRQQLDLCRRCRDSPTLEGNGMSASSNSLRMCETARVAIDAVRWILLPQQGFASCWQASTRTASLHFLIRRGANSIVQSEGWSLTPLPAKNSRLGYQPSAYHRQAE